MYYYLMRKDEALALIDISKTGIDKIIDVNPNNEELLPLHQPKDKTASLREWWNDRAVPLTQKGIKEVLHKNNLTIPSEFLLNNLGLSLTDYYWIKPIDSELTWDKVNLFSNNFETKIDFQIQSGSKRKYTPNASLQGDLEKYWTINDNDERILIKGNRDDFSREAINEVIVSKINNLQKYDNYVDYDLLSMNNRDYKYACYCKNFVDLDNEFIPAISIINSKKKRNNINYFEHFINVCVEHGIDKEQLQHDLDYMLFLDFVTTNVDRHWNNFGIIRDSKTLKFKRLAPIFDSGCSFFVGKTIPKTYRDFSQIKLNSINTTEAKQIKLIKDKNVFDFNLLPDKDYIIKMFDKDDNLNQTNENLKYEIANSFEVKVKIAKKFQNDIQLNHKPKGKSK